MNEPVEFDMKALQKRVSESVQAQFAAMMPPEVFNNLVAKAVEEFFNQESQFPVHEIPDPNYQGNSWNRPNIKVFKEYMTPFKHMVFEEIRPLVREALTKWTQDNSKKIKQQVVDTLNDPILSSPINKAVGAMAVVYPQVQIMTAMNTALQDLSNRAGTELIRAGLQNTILFDPVPNV